jgi:PTS system mannose-specific IIA component
MSEKQFVGAVLVTHGGLGEELRKITEGIVGSIAHIAAVSIGWHDNVEASKARIQKTVESVDQGKGVIIVTDMFGGTPSNISLSLLEKDRVEIMTGVNLPMVIKLANQRGDETLHQLATRVRDQGKSQISIAGELLGE